MPASPSSSSSSSSSPPSSSFSPSSTSNSSPSPPRLDHRDEPKPLSLVGAEGAPAGPKRTRRSVPCLQCRGHRRVCRWGLGEGTCERCYKLGKDCSGPYRPPKTPLLALRQDFAVETARTAGEEVSGDIGPSSTSARWMRKHQGYALSYHLVETCLKHTEGMMFVGVDLGDFKRRMGDQNGRVSEMSPNHELLALGFMVLGTQLTSHTSIIGTSPSPSPSSELGLRRLDPIVKLLDKIADRAHPLRLELRTSDAVDRLALTLLALDSLRLPEYGSVRRKLLSETFEYGAGLLEDEELAEKLRGPARGYLQALAREEIRQGLECGVSSSVSPYQHRNLFGETFPPPALYDPDLNALSHLFVTDKALLPSTAADSYTLHDAMFGSIEGIYDHLDFVLAFTPRVKLLHAVEYLYRHLDNLAAYYDRQFERVFEDPRYALLPAEMRLHRPATLLSVIMQYEVLNLNVLWTCQLALETLDGHEEELRAGAERIFEEVSRIARRMRHLPSISDRLMLHHVVCSRLSRALDLLRPSYLLPWSKSNPEERDMLLVALRLGSSSLPEAARLVRLLETGDARYAEYSTVSRSPSLAHSAILGTLPVSSASTPGGSRPSSPLYPPASSTQYRKSSQHLASLSEQVRDRWRARRASRGTVVALVAGGLAFWFVVVRILHLRREPTVPCDALHQPGRLLVNLTSPLHTYWRPLAEDRCPPLPKYLPALWDLTHGEDRGYPQYQASVFSKEYQLIAAEPLPKPALPPLGTKPSSSSKSAPPADPISFLRKRRLHPPTVLVLGDSVDRNGLVHFCQLFRRNVSISHYHDIRRHPPPPYPADLTKGHGPKFDGWDQRGLMHKCEIPYADGSGVAMRVVNGFHYGMDALDEFNTPDHTDWHAPGRIETRIDELVVPAVEQLGGTDKIDVVQIHSGMWDLALFGMQDDKTRWSLTVPLTPEQLAWWQERMRHTIFHVRQRFPKARIVFRKLHRTDDSVAGTQYITNLYVPPRVHQLRHLQEEVARTEGLPVFDFGHVLEGYQYFQEKVHPLLVPGGVVYAHNLVHQLRLALESRASWRRGWAWDD